MTRKTEGIVLRSLKYQDNHLIATVYTEAYGMQSFLIKGYHSPRARRRHSFFQPLSIIDLVYFYKETQQLQKVNESHLSLLLHSVQSHPVKLSIGLAMMEIFYDTVKEEEENRPLYHFLRSCILQLEQSERRLVQVFIFFLLHLTKFLGFFPLDKSQQAPRVTFDLKQGCLLPAEDDQPAMRLLRDFLHSSLHTCQQISFDARSKRQLLRLLFSYYQHYVPGFKYPQTLRVFAEIFD